MNSSVLLIPGWSGSNSGNWQSLWAKQNPATFHFVEQDDWMDPNLDDWLHGLDRALLQINGPVALVAYSLGVPLVAHWASSRDASKISGALLVAMCDPDHPECISGFGQFPLTEFLFPSIVVASSNDYWCSLERSKHFAECWGSRFIDIGPCGHIDTGDGFGPWPEGLGLLQQLIRA